ncbi:MAG: PstA family ABC transporter permease, partial [Paracoccaceae bacterium]
MIDFSRNAGFNLAARHRAEQAFQWAGRLAILISLGFLAWMMVSVTIAGSGALKLVEIAIPVDLGEKNVDPADIGAARFGSIVKKGLRAAVPEVTKRKDKKKLYNLISSEAPFELERRIENDPALLGGNRLVWVTASDDLSLYVRGKLDVSGDESLRQISDREIGWIREFQERGHIRTVANWRFLSGGDSREPEVAGILAALVGSALSLAVCFMLSFPIGVAAATYLEEFAPKNRLSDVIEVNINNLAAVPSIVFGLLGLSIFLGYFGLPRSSPLVGGMVLSLMTLPTIIIASRASLKSVPPSIKEAALALGATPVQAVFH